MDKIIYNIASYRRGDTLINTIQSIYNQCDVINVTLNNYDEIPVELYDKKINLFISDNDRGDAYKFYKLTDSDGYFFTIDDDLIYPENYTEYMIDKVNQYNRKSIITLHARTFGSFPINSFYGRNTLVYHFRQLLTEDTKVQFGGTGVMCFHTDLFKVPIEYFDRPNMADVWIGKYAKENNIDIICAKHNSGFVNQQDFNGSIYEKDLRSDDIQTILTNESYLDKEVSVIIPTFNNVDFLKECLDSVVNSCNQLQNFEILVGIDKCEKTLRFVQDNVFDFRIKFFYFEENVGPYVIKNTLSKISKTENLIFFDSDDVMSDDMVSKIVNGLVDYECIKPMYHDFRGEINYDDPKYKLYSNLFGEGVFGIRKYVFLRFNGFEGWRCAADSDFMVRTQKNGVTFKRIEETLFYRRIHENGLTTNPETNYGSKLRKHYIELTNSKTNFGPLDEMKISDFTRIYTKTEITKISYRNIIPTKPVIETPQHSTEDTLKQVYSKSTVINNKVKPINTEDKIPSKPIEKVDNSEVEDIRKNILSLLSDKKVVKKINKDLIDQKRQNSRDVVIPYTIQPVKKTSRTSGINTKRGGGFNF
jgi:glycosyltransferase involved in cell wall biosynthesis